MTFREWLIRERLIAKWARERCAVIDWMDEQTALGLYPGRTNRPAPAHPTPPPYSPAWFQLVREELERC